MSRRHRAEKRETIPDIRYSSPLVAHLINVIMERGKKSLAQRIVYGAFERVSEKVGKGDPVDLMIGALENARPRLEVKSRRVGGATYQVPVEISYERQESLALRWIVAAATARKGIPMPEALAAEIVDAYNNTGTVVKKKEDTHKMAQANRAFAVAAGQRHDSGRHRHSGRRQSHEREELGQSGATPRQSAICREHRRRRQDQSPPAFPARDHDERRRFHVRAA